MGRYDLKHVDRGIVYIPVNDNTTEQEINNAAKEYDCTVVFFRSGKYSMKNILKELIKTTLST